MTFLGGAALALAWMAGGRMPAQAAQAGPGKVAVREGVVDETGRNVALPPVVRRVVSIAPSLTETIYALGAEDLLVGVTDYCDYPPQARTKPRVGAPLNPSLEAVVALKPDLVLATTAINRRETVESLERLGIAVYATDPRSVEGLLDSIRSLAKLIGVPEKGQALVAGLRERLEELRWKLAGRPALRALFVVWEDPLITIGPHTFLADALRWAGAESVVEARQDWPHLSLEEVVRLQPDELVFASSHAETATRDSAELRTRPGWRELTAVRQGHIAVISDAIDRPAPRLVDAIEQLARQLHPEAFETKQETQKDENGKKKTGTRGLKLRFDAASLFFFPSAGFAFPAPQGHSLCSL